MMDHFPITSSRTSHSESSILNNGIIEHGLINIIIRDGINSFRICPLQEKQIPRII